MPLPDKIVLDLTGLEAARKGRDWSWYLSWAINRDDEELFNFRIHDWTGKEMDEEATVYWGTALSPEIALDRALAMAEKAERAMG